MPVQGLYGCMIIDDEAIVRNDLKTLINWEEAGFTIVGEASNGKSAISLFHEIHPELVIVDIKMPIMGGLEMIKALSADVSDDVVFFLLTAYEDFDFARTAIDLNVTKYMLKHELNEKSLLAVLSSVRKSIDERRLASRIARKHRGDDCRVLSNKIAEVIQYIHENFAHDISLSDVSQFFSMSELYLGQLFKKETGVYFKQYLTAFRMTRAKELLLSGQFKVYEVCELVGLQNVQYFTNVFKRYTGISPGKYSREGD